MPSTCDWNTPGHDPYTGTSAAALSHYDMPDTTRRRLADRIERNDFDTVVSVTRDGITGYAGMRNMHFGKDRMCHDIDVSKWDPLAVQLGFVFIEDGHHVVKWFICHNITELIPLPPVAHVSTLVGGDAFDTLPLFYADAPGVMRDFSTHGQADTFAAPLQAGYLVGTGGPGGGVYVAGGSPGAPCPCPPDYAPPAITPPVPAVPEPSTWAMICAGFIALVIKVRSCRQ